MKIIIHEGRIVGEAGDDYPGPMSSAPKPEGFEMREAHLWRPGEGGRWVKQPPPIPAISQRQARLVLASTPAPEGSSLATMLDAVEAAIEALPEPARTPASITWRFAAEVRRDDPLVTQLATALGLSAGQVDALFELGASL